MQAVADASSDRLPGKVSEPLGHSGSDGATNRPHGQSHAAMIPSRFSLAISSAWLPAPFLRLQKPHSSW